MGQNFEMAPGFATQEPVDWDCTYHDTVYVIGSGVLVGWPRTWYPPYVRSKFLLRFFVDWCFAIYRYKVIVREVNNGSKRFVTVGNVMSLCIFRESR